MSTPLEAGVWAAGAVVTLSGFTGVLWWLVWPRIEDKLQEVVSEVGGVRHVLDDDAPGSIGRHARVAAGAAAELPGIRAELERLASEQRNLGEWRLDVDRRLGGVEQVMVALAGPELRRRLLEDIAYDRDTNRDTERRNQG